MATGYGSTRAAAPRLTRCLARCLAALAVGAALTLASSAPALASPGSSPSRATVPVIPTGAVAAGSLPGSTPVQATVTLEPRDPGGLAAYARAVSTPGTPLYHQHLSVAQFVQRFGPGPAQIAAVTSALEAQGLQVGQPTANELSIPVTGSAATIESAFATPLERYRLSHGRTIYSNTVSPTVEPSIAPLVQSVVGLDKVAPSPGLTGPAVAGGKHAAARSAATPGPATSAAGPHPCASATSTAKQDQSYTADQIASAYGLSTLYATGDLGRGTTIALYELEPFSSSDVAAYQSCYGTSASVSTVAVAGGAGTGSGSGEAAVDVEDVIGLAPGAKVKVYEGPDNGMGAYSTYAQIIADDSAQVISTSWGLCESQEGTSTAQAENTLDQEAAAQGQSILAASGDSGSDDCGNGARGVDDPASQPWVTGVGATSLVSGVESVWNNSTGASGGGVSTVWGQPSYQSGHAAAQSSISCGASGTSCRQVPDVSADGDPQTGSVMYYQGHWITVGGTSVSTPTWAALITLADASGTCAGTPVGFVNPALYSAAANSADFNDVTSGNNGFGGVLGFSAGPGYDMASGLGSPHAGSLAPSLCGDTVRIAQPPAQSSAAGVAQKLQLTATSSAGSQLAYSAANLPAGLTITSGGTISGYPTSSGSKVVLVTVTDTSGASANARFTWSISSNAAASLNSPSISLRVPGNQSGHVRRAEQLRIKARDLRGLPLTYRARGLPAGLSINHRGLISGTPTRASEGLVHVTASDAAGDRSSAIFGWVVAGAPRVTARSLHRLAAGRGGLSLRVSAGVDAPALRRIVISAPTRALRFSPIQRGLTSASSGPGPRRAVRVGIRLVRGILTVALGPAASHPATLRLLAAPVRLGHGVTRGSSPGGIGAVRLTITVYDATGYRTKLTATT